ncbi:sugar phosphate isomerase [Bacillus sp. AFS076308]|uniref:sugar phosphate isomerase/epimerase family protein n=1 Tax=unclassified Bacillus (in: firmicutes) TaxID=185979 RepID=UPI000BF2DDFF|nr:MULTISPECIES: sugar phosphate isomerase/epimerase family protein [unclassified Bacillus (in: firmicutes)]PFN99576.1 sugar phosphate isomerase [Bacillus sp. AFS076308]PGV50252.1 sugar phosphate isomerase [Bacillus sp. AFS037270]
MFKYSFDSLVYFGEDVEKSIERVAKFGYDAIELVGEPDAYDTKRVRNLVSDYGITVGSICSIYNAERDLAHPDPNKRRQAIDYVKRVADMSAEVECPVMIVAPTANGKTASLTDFDDEVKWAIEGIREGAEYAAKLNVNLCIEAWNRYETYMLNRLDQAMDMWKEVNLPNVGIMGDLFHMNIEEDNIAEAIRKSGDALIHIHFADSNRKAPGLGQIDFVPALQALKDIDYKGHITFEILPAAADPFGVMKKGGGLEFFDDYTKKSIDHIKSLEKSLFANTK